MKYLGADPQGAMDEIERFVVVQLHNRVIKEQERQSRG